MQTRRYVVDRVDSGLLVLVPDEKHPTLTLPASEYPFHVNDVVDIGFDENGIIVSAVANPDERELRLSKVSSRLRSLFNKSKK